MAKISSLLALLFIILSSIMINHLHVASSTKWCVAKMNATNAQLQGNINFGCSEGVDCVGQFNQADPSHGRTKKACSFKNTGTFAVTDPSFGKCVYVS
ncbi:putative glucan endo-1,3-beta-D-glucosidase [Arabidopsis thaliana]